MLFNSGVRRIVDDVANELTEGCFFFQAEDGIRDYDVTGVQTCALPICRGRLSELADTGAS